MPGLDWGLNFLDPGLQAASKRLSFSDPDSPSSDRGRSTLREANWNSRYDLSPPRRQRLPRIDDSPVHSSQCTAPPSSLGTSGALYSAPTSAPVATSPALALAAPSRLHQLLEEAEAALQQLQQQDAWAAAAARLQSQSEQLRLYKVDGGPVGYEAKWEELHPVSQGLLLQIEDNIREYRDDSERLDQCSSLDDLSLCNMNFELNAIQITQEVGSISTIMDREKISVESLMIVIKEIMWHTDFAIRSYVKLMPRFVHQSAGSANSGFGNHSGFSGVHTDFSQLLTVAPTSHCYSGAPRRPSPFVQHAVARFEDHLGVCCKWILELEQLVHMKNDKTFAETLESLSKVMSNVLDYLIHVASKVEHICQYVETVKTRYLNDRQRRGVLRDPFLEANRREAAKQEANARIVHPMLHLSPPGQPTTPVAAPMIASQLQQTSFHTVATSQSSCLALPPPSLLPPSSTQASPAPLTNLFSSSRSVLQSTPFGSFSTLALGSTPATSLFGTGIPSSATSLFPIPSGGGTTASGINHVPSKESEL